MSIIKIHYDKRTPQVAEEEEVVSGQRQTIAIQFDFSPEWSEFPEKTAVFTSVAAKKSYMLDEDGKVDIPEEVIINGVREFSVSVFGVREGENGEIPRYNGKPTKFSVTRGGDLPGNDTTSDGKPTAYEQLLYKFEVVNSKVVNKLDAFQGEDNAGKLLYVDGSGNVAYLQLGTGLEIVDGRLCIIGTVTPDEPDEPDEPDTPVEPDEAITFAQTGENRVAVSGVVFEQQENGTVLWRGTTFAPGEGNTVIIS